ncbi:hypothetical protein GGS20DRAFT_560040 [Poronia punctata]|nr:hypothetical protein GGS20DRAFT_560040 [Poronia punctata]
MGIKGIYKEIGPGERISLAKLAVQKLEESKRPLRIAIDISIWQFQVQAARGGSNPAIRTLFYRLLRLLSLSIQPIFVFDGPNKPVFKRNKRSGRGDGVASAMAKRLIRLFGFVTHDAPGEAEAECALLQQKGVVDAVLSEDVDTIMFGCTRTLRNWSSEGTKGSKTPTHVSMYESEGLGLDREGMVLVALMSGGDYLPEGIPGAGVKVACEAARAGFGTSLCQLKRSDSSELASWRERLAYELRVNESGFFRTKHKALNIPADFPNMEILRYYTHPVVSPASTVERLKQQNWDRPVEIQGLREFVRETFDWNYRIGAVKYIRVLAPCLLVHKLMQRSTTRSSQAGDAIAVERGEQELVRRISSRRAHFSTDATPELRLSFVPTSIVGYNFQQEPDEMIEFGRDGIALNSDDDIEELQEEAADGEFGTKSGPKKRFSPTEPDSLWVPEKIAELSIPCMVERWRQTQSAKTMARSKAKPKPSSRMPKTGGTPAESLDKFVRVSKNITPQATKVPDRGKAAEPLERLRASPFPIGNTRDVFPTSSQASSTAPSPLPPSQASQKARTTRPSKPSTSKPRARKEIPEAPKADRNTNPWTIASSQASPRITTRCTKSAKISEPILISSSPPTSPTSSPKAPVSSVRSTRNDHSRNTSGLFPTQPSSRTKRRSLTPPTATLGEPESAGGSVAQDSSPVLTHLKKSQKKLSRTESLPVAPSPKQAPRRTGGLSRAQTVATDILEEDGSDDDYDLPPLSSFLGRIPGEGKKDSNNPTPIRTNSSKPRPEKMAGGIGEKEGKPKEKQTTLNKTLGTRTTKLYIPRKSEPGFFKEVEVSAEEADALKEEYAKDGSGNGNSRRTGVWRRSDVQYIDLTAED